MKIIVIFLLAIAIAIATNVNKIFPPAVAQANCASAYPTICLPASPDLDCKDIAEKKFQVLSPDIHDLDSDKDGIGCEK